MDLKIPYNNLSNADDAYRLACELITPEYIEKWKVKAQVATDDTARAITATGKGFTLSLEFTQDEAIVACDLSFMLKAFKGTILEAIGSKLKKHI
jgi:hypothetical protein